MVIGILAVLKAGGAYVPIDPDHGTVAAYALARLNFPGKQAIQAFVLSPLMIPQIALGVSFLYLLTMIGICSNVFDRCRRRIGGMD